LHVRSYTLFVCTWVCVRGYTSTHPPTTLTTQASLSLGHRFDCV